VRIRWSIFQNPNNFGAGELRISNTDEELKYMNRTMDHEPINSSLSAIADLLRGGDPAIAILEPGDATRYRLCLLPCWSSGICTDLGEVGIPQDHAAEYLLVTRFDAKGGEAFFASSSVESFDLEIIRNKWSREFLSWWLRRLWGELEQES